MKNYSMNLTYSGNCLQQYKSNEKTNWKSKHNGISVD